MGRFGKSQFFNSLLGAKLHFGTRLSAKLSFPSPPAMRSRDRIHEPHAAHFVTSTIVAWLPVFTTAARCALPVQSWLHCREHKGLRIHGWAGKFK